MTRVNGEISINVKQEIVWEILADLGEVSTWNPTIINSYYISEATSERISPTGSVTEV